MNSDSENEASVEGKAKTAQKTNYAKLLFFLPFTWSIAGLTGLGAYAVSNMFLGRHDQDELTLLGVFATVVTCLFQSGSGSYVLGTLMRNGNKWILTALSCVPILIFQVVIAVAILGGNNNTAKDVVECLSILLTPVIAYHALRAGQNTRFEKRQAALDVSWKHWMWILPLGLYPAVCVPLFLLLLMWKIDFLLPEPSIFSLLNPLVIGRIVVFMVLMGILAALMAAYGALVDTSRSLGSRFLRICGVWVLLVLMQCGVLFFSFSKNVMEVKAQRTAVFDHFTKVISLNPNDSMSYYRRARAYAGLTDPANSVTGKEEELQKGVDDLTKAIALDPQNYEAYILRGLVYHEQEKSEPAIADFTKAIDLKPSSPAAYSLRGDRLDDRSAAHADFEKAITLKASTAFEYYYRAIAFRRLKEIAKSFDDLKMACQLDPNDPVYIGLKAATEKEMGNNEAAIADGAGALHAMKDEEPLFRERGKAYLQTQDYESAIEKLTHAISLNPNNAESYFLRSQAYSAVNEGAAANDDLTHAASLDKKYAKKQASDNE
jgi:tetratricopeptide (TPR) repeat protein